MQPQVWGSRYLNRECSRNWNFSNQVKTVYLRLEFEGGLSAQHVQYNTNVVIYGYHNHFQKDGYISKL